MLLKHGDKVRFSGSVNIESFELDVQGEWGTVTLISMSKGPGPKDWHPGREGGHGYIEEIRVRLDRRFPELDVWNNEIYFQREGLLSDIVQILSKPK